MDNPLAKKLVHKLTQTATKGIADQISPFDAAPEALKSVGELADTIDAPRKYFIDKAFDQMDFSRKYTGESDPLIAVGKQAADIVIPSVYDLVPGSKSGAKAAQIVERNTAKALGNAEKKLSKTVVVPTAQEISEAKALSNKVIMPTKEKSTAQILIERAQAQKMQPVSVVPGPTVKSTSVIPPK